MNDDRIRIVIVEDYKLLRIGLISFLNKDESIEVVGEAGSGEEGLKVIREQQPDVVIVDLGLPGINGIELTEKIKALNADTRIMILTSHESEDEVIAALGAGANAYCVKGVEASGLLDVVKAVYEGATWLDPAIAAIGLKLFQQGAQDKSVEPTVEPTDYELSEQEFRTLELLVMGMNNSEIAEELHISVHTVKAYVSKILSKMAVNDRVQAAVKAVKSGMV